MPGCRFCSTKWAPISVPLSKKINNFWGRERERYRYIDIYNIPQKEKSRMLLKTFKQRLEEMEEREKEDGKACSTASLAAAINSAKRVTFVRRNARRARG